MRRLWLVLAAFLGLAASVAPASADITWSLTQAQSGWSGSPYGTITAHQLTSDTIQVTINLSSYGTGSNKTQNVFVATGSHSGITWDMSVVPTSISITSSNASKFTVQPIDNGNGSYGNSPFGSFEYAISWNGNGASSANESSIVFDITKTGGLTLSSGLFTKNSGNNYWGVDIGLKCKDGCSKTGVVAANTVPEPGTWTLSIAGLMGLAGFAMAQRRRKPVRTV
jgi:hypothetical protein